MLFLHGRISFFFLLKNNMVILFGFVCINVVHLIYNHTLAALGDLF